MSLLPEWAPNAHPLLVHFPIALLVTAVVLDLAGVVVAGFSRHTSLATSLYTAGTVTLAATYLTGRLAAETVFLPGMAHAVLASHWSWALWAFTGLTTHDSCSATDLPATCDGYCSLPGHSSDWPSWLGQPIWAVGSCTTTAWARVG